MLRDGQLEVWLQRAKLAFICDCGECGNPEVVASAREGYEYCCGADRSWCCTCVCLSDGRILLATGDK